MIELRDRIAKAIWAKRPDCAGKPWPLADDYSRRAYKHNPIAAVDLCYVYADAALAVMAETERWSGGGDMLIEAFGTRSDNP